MTNTPQLSIKCPIIIIDNFGALHALIVTAKRGYRLWFITHAPSLLLGQTMTHSFNLAYFNGPLLFQDLSFDIRFNPIVIDKVNLNLLNL